VFNASPVILMGKVGGLGLLDRLGVPTLVPATVLREISAGLDVTKGPDDLVHWATARGTTDIPIPLSVERWDLGAGESQVIAHCLLDDTAPCWTMRKDELVRARMRFRSSERWGLCCGLSNKVLSRLHVPGLTGSARSDCFLMTN
jgi:hypothetical protein